MATKETPKETVDRTDWPFHDKVVYVQEKLNAPKSNENSFGGYKYRSAEDIVEAVKPILRDVNLLLNLTDEVEQIGDRYYVKATATLVDTDRSISSTAFARETEVKKGMDEAQITGSASSYARKYALNGVLAIDDTKDPDSHDNRDHAPASTAKPLGSSPAAKEEEPTEKQVAFAKQLMNDKGFTGAAAVKICKELIGKQIPTSKEDYTQLIAKLLEYKGVPEAEAPQEHPEELGSME